jgi:hypothetical protein
MIRNWQKNYFQDIEMLGDIIYRYESVHSTVHLPFAIIIGPFMILISDHLVRVLWYLCRHGLNRPSVLRGFGLLSGSPVFDNIVVIL